MTAETTHKATKDLGPCVVNNELLWTSASGVMVADPHTYGGCTRKWYFDQVLGLKPGSTSAQSIGTALHAEVEGNILHGTPLTHLALSGREFIPARGPGLLVEQPIAVTEDGVMKRAYLQARGNRKMIPFAGHVDLWNFRGEYVNEDGVLTPEPRANTLETKDWKTTSSFDFAKTATELGQNLQMVTYAEAGFRMWPHLENARLTHVNFRTRGAPAAKLVTILRSREEIDERWKYTESVVRTMEDAAVETNADKVPTNPRSCSAYGGCAHRDRCTAHRQSSLDALFGKVAADFTKGDTPVGLLQNNQIMQQPPAAQPDMRAQLAAEEQQLRAQQAVAQAPQITPASVLEAWTRIERHGRGVPALGGQAAHAYAAAKGYPPIATHAGFAGTGNLAQIQLMEPAHIFQLAAELDGQAPAPPPQVYVPPPAPPQAIYTGPPAGGQSAGVPQQVYGGILPPGTPESQPQLAQAYVPPPGAIVGLATTGLAAPQSVALDAPAEPTKKKAGRPKKDVTPPPMGTAPEQAAPPTQPVAPATQTAAVPHPVEYSTVPAASQVAPVSGPAFADTTAPAFQTVVTTTVRDALGPDDHPVKMTSICINARVLGVQTKSLSGYVDYINGELSRRYCVDAQGKPTIQDVRCAPKDSVLGFGGWKGAVREVVKADPPQADAYHLDTHMDELNEAVADALRIVAEQKGWLYVRGTR